MEALLGKGKSIVTQPFGRTERVGEAVFARPDRRRDDPTGAGGDVAGGSEPSVQEDRLAIPNEGCQNQVPSALPADSDGPNHYIPDSEQKGRAGQ